MSKCEWKELRLDDLPEIDFTKKPQEQYDIQIYNNDSGWCYTGHRKWWLILREMDENKIYYRYRKPEPKVIIKKSGETWVARYNGIDYLCVNPKQYLFPEITPELVMETYLEDWKPISEIEITDELAKLRPTIIYDKKSLSTLYAVDGEHSLITDVDEPFWQCTKGSVSLATMEDLP